MRFLVVRQSAQRFDKHYSVYSDVGFKVKDAKDMVQHCLGSFPYLWVCIDSVLIMHLGVCLNN